VSVKISIVTICYNPGPDLEPTVQSVLNQTYQNIDYVIVDGGSTDGSIEKIKALSTKDKRINWISEPDNGIYDAMNKGIKMSAGHWVNFMNAGDSFANEMVLSSIDFGKFKDQGLIYGNITRDHETVIYPKSTNLLKYGKIMACHQSMFFNQARLGEELRYDSSLILNGDAELVTRIQAKNFGIKYIDKLIAFYLGGGASSNFIGKSKMQKYKRVWNYFGIVGIFKTISMALGLVNLEKFKVK